MIKFASIQPGKEGDRLEILRVATLNGGVVDNMKRVEKGAAYLADIMASLHGGQWQAQVDHQIGFVHVQRIEP